MKHAFAPVAKRRIKAAFHLVGLDIRKAPSAPNGWLKELAIRTVLDIGANEGQFARDIHQILPDAKIISFEPLRDCYEALLAQADVLGAFEVHNFALGEESGTAEINRSVFSPSSSLLAMGDAHKRAFPFTAETTSETIRTERLDGLNLLLEQPLLVKMDVQGFEDRVIRGGKQTIGSAAAVIVEVSYAEEFYEGQASFDDIYLLLAELGFTFRGHQSQVQSKTNGAPLYADAIFIKDE